ncbi:MAG: signal peptidase I [Deinococcaceae bacterium]
MTEDIQVEQDVPKGFWHKLWREIIRPYGEAIVFAILVTTFLVTSVGVQGVSMMPNLRDGERVIIPKYEQWLHRMGIGQYSRGDILIFKPPEHVGEQKVSFLGLWQYQPFLIKRLIGLPGDRIRVNSGNVFINGEKLDQDFTAGYWDKQGCWDQTGFLANHASSDEPDKEEVTVPEGSYFVMGDNRTASGSTDSRIFGMVPIENVSGRAGLIVWPIVRKREAKFDCEKEIQGSEGFEYSGETEMNWRLLQRPSAFSLLK